jgi:hypothetical protein
MGGMDIPPVSTAERVAAVVGLAVAGFLLFVCLDMALGGRLFGSGGKRPCGCEEADDAGD